MAVSKRRKHPKKRNKQARTRREFSGVISVIDVPEMPTANEIAAFHVLGVDYYRFGRRAKEDGAEALTLDEFVEGFGLRDWECPGDLSSVLAQAQFEQYRAGYTGTTYHDIIFREVNL